MSLEYDKDRKDQFERTLTQIRLADGTYVSDEIARAGLGVPVVYGRNDDRISDVRDALADAADSEVGYFDSAIECTMTSQVEEAERAVEEALAIDEGSNAADAAAAAAALLTVVEGHLVLKKTLDMIERPSELEVKALLEAGQSTRLASLRAQLDEVAVEAERMEELSSAREKQEAAAK